MATKLIRQSLEG